MTSPPQSATTRPPDKTSAWEPLRQPLFRALWIAAVVSNIGTWMHDVGAGWLMTSLAPSPVMVTTGYPLKAGQSDPGSAGVLAGTLRSACKMSRLQ